MLIRARIASNVARISADSIVRLSFDNRMHVNDIAIHVYVFLFKLLCRIYLQFHLDYRTARSKK
ncbi:hypothetical protein PUN28_002297 [Cardiocondyla obscurior]|uniref:Uncharacterized protein n=1 Tax=Cardiocondyla obscurior TaxID=286306 RepID=A0AAW2GTE9_9HYME